MRTCLHKPMHTQEINAAATMSLRRRLAQSRKENWLTNLQRTMGNQGVRRLIETKTAEAKGGLATIGIGSFDNDVSPMAASKSLAGHHVGTAASSTSYELGAQHRENELADGPEASTQVEDPATVAPAPEPTTTPAAQPVNRPIAAADRQNETVTDAPSQTYIVPFDRSPLAAPGERIIFRAVFTDPSPADYQLEYSTTGGHFTSATGSTTRTIAGLTSGNVDFIVPTPWDGSTPVQVVLRVRKISDNSVAQTETWNFGLKTRYPTTMTQQEDASERDIPGIYHYSIGPALATGTAPYYQHQTILERFGNWSLANIAPADIAEPYRTSNSLTTTAAVSQHFLGNYAGNNGTFTVDGMDRIADRHGGHPDLSNLVAHLAAAKQIEVALPQTYEAQPGVVLGSYTVTRVLRADGTTWKVRKG